MGVDKLVETGKLDHLKGGPLFWVDSADSHPCMGEGFTIQGEVSRDSVFTDRLVILFFVLPGTASAAMWTLRTEGRLFHSGLPHKGINSMELGMEAIAYVQNKFYQDFPPVSFNTDSYIHSVYAPPVFLLVCILACVCGGCREGWAGEASPLRGGRRKEGMRGVGGGGAGGEVNSSFCVCV